MRQKHCIVCTAVLLLALLAGCGSFNECSGLECQNTGECRITASGEARCICEGAYYGEFCESFDACYNISCPPNATCNEGDCLCKLGYEGGGCETASREKFLGSYVATESCADSQTGGNELVSVFECSIYAHDSIALRLQFSNGGAQGLLSNVYVTLTDSFSFHLPEQTDTVLARVFEGIGNGRINSAADTVLADYFAALLPVDSTKRCGLVMVRQ